VSQDGTVTFIREWLKKIEQEKPDSKVVQSISSATRGDQLDEVKLLRLLQEEAKPVEEHNCAIR